MTQVQDRGHSSDAGSAGSVHHSGVLLVEQQGAVKHLFLNRPHKRNALNLALADAILAALEQASADGTRLVVFQGKGAGFCAGFDFSELDTSSPGDLLLQFVRIEQMLQAVAHASVDTLALAHGAAIGAGADLLVACRHRVGSADVQSRFPGARFGLILGSRRLAQCVGAQTAQRLIGSADKVTAQAMLGSGLIGEVLEASEWPQHTQQVLQQVSQVAPQTRAQILRLMRDDTRAQDMMELVASAAHPQVKARIAAYLGAANA